MSDENKTTANQLRSFVERIERLGEEKDAIRDDIREVYSELKGTGFDPKIVRLIIRLRKQEPATRREEELLLETYKNALGIA